MVKRGGSFRSFLTCLTLIVMTGSSVFLFLSCSSLKSSRPVVPMREYEKMLVGPLFADYVGNEACLAACHTHDRNAAVLEESAHGQLKVEGTEMPLVNCESCHGPGSEAIAQDYIEKHGQCDTTEFIPIRRLPAGAQALLCLKCHSSYSLGNVQYWPDGEHARNEVACQDCHKLHKGSKQKAHGKEINDLCFSCHEKTKAEFAFSSRHPVPDGIMLCTDCHDPHGTGNQFNIKAMDMKSLCINCHGQFIGPFTFEHADLTDDCTTCHNTHGSMFPDLLTYQEPFLCLQCHTGHTDFTDPGSPSPGFKQAFYTKCTNCHSQIHGTDTRGPHPGSGFTQ